MQCEITQLALNMDEKITLQRWIHKHKAMCPTISTCNYSLTFNGTDKVMVKCGECGEGHELFGEVK